MDGSHDTDTRRTSRTRRSYAPFGPVLWIAVLLGCWFLIGQWNMLPDMVSATMAALP
jgi:hypothetical protein